MKSKLYTLIAFITLFCIFMPISFAGTWSDLSDAKVVVPDKSITPDPIDVVKEIEDYLPEKFIKKIWVGDYIITDSDRLMNAYPEHTRVKISDLADCIEIAGSLVIRLTDLRSLAGLENLIRIQELYIYSNPSLHSLDGMESLTSVGKLFIVNNAVLTNLEGLSSLAAVDDADTYYGVYIYRNPILPTCEAEWLVYDVIGEENISGLIQIDANDDEGTCPW